MKKLTILIVVALLLMGMLIVSAHQETSYPRMDADCDGAESDDDDGDSGSDNDGGSESDTDSDTESGTDDDSGLDTDDDSESDTGGDGGSDDDDADDDTDGSDGGDGVSFGTGGGLATTESAGGDAESDSDDCDTESDTDTDTNDDPGLGTSDDGGVGLDTGGDDTESDSDGDTDSSDGAGDGENDDVDTDYEDTESDTDDDESDTDDSEELEESETTTPNASITKEPETSSILLIHDGSVSCELVRLMGNYATALGIPVFEKRIDFDSRYLHDMGIGAVGDVGYVVLIARDVSGLNVLIDYVVSDRSLDGKKMIISSDVGEGMLKQHSLVLQKAASPESLILTDLDDSDLVWNALLSAESQGRHVEDELDSEDVDYTTVSDYDLVTTPAHRLVVTDAMLTASESKIPLEALKLVLILPFAATVIAIFRNVIGVRMYGVFGPAIMSIAFLSSGLVTGLILFAILLAAGLFSRKSIDRLNLMIVPRLAILLTLCCIVMAVIITVGIKMGNYTLAKTAVFPLLVMSTIVENFMKAVADKGLFDALKICLGTIVAAVTCFFVVSLSTLQAIVMTHPEVLVLVLGFNVLLGRWKGLRLVEYFRFSELRKG
ncbi:MAG: hypothetical protein BA869_10820 [Desulfuromonadales bacterium C00003107]|nr:MAG: hypothetical protein BA869_10820 [Desulfuromonadales bacterium C00003107]